jgi:hypothetical protein
MRDASLLRITISDDITASTCIGFQQNRGNGSAVSTQQAGSRAAFGGL